MDLERKKVPELKEIAKGLGIKVQKLKRAELILAIKQAGGNKNRASPDSHPAAAAARLTPSQKRMRGLNPDLFERVRADLHMIPDIRPFSATLVMQAAWAPWEELVFEYEAFATRASVFGSLEATFLAYVAQEFPLEHIPEDMSPYLAPEAFFARKHEVYAILKPEGFSDLYNSYPLVMWIYLVDNPTLGRMVSAERELLYIASCMGEDHPYSIRKAMKRIGNCKDPPYCRRNLLVIELKMKIAGEIGYLPWETVDPLHEQIAEVIFRGEVEIKRYESMAAFKKIWGAPDVFDRLIEQYLGQLFDRLIELYLGQPHIIKNITLYTELANEMYHPLSHMGARRYARKYAEMDLQVAPFTHGWNTDAAVFFLTDAVGDRGVIEIIKSREAVFKVLVEEPIEEEEIGRFMSRLLSSDSVAVEDFLPSVVELTNSKYRPDNVIAILTALLHTRDVKKLKTRFEEIVRMFARKNHEPNALKTILLWDKLNGRIELPAFFETMIANLRREDFESVLSLPLMQEKSATAIINQGWFGYARKVSMRLKLIYKAATRSIRNKMWDNAYSQLEALVLIFSEIPEAHLWVLLLHPILASGGDHSRKEINPLLEKAFEELGVAAVLDIYIQLGVLEGVELAFERGATTKTIDPLMLPGKPPQLIMFLKAKQAAGE